MAKIKQEWKKYKPKDCNKYRSWDNVCETDGKICDKTCSQFRLL